MLLATGTPASRSLVKSMSLDSSPGLDAAQGKAQASGLPAAERPSPARTVGERPSASHRSAGAKPQVPPKPTHLHRPWRTEPIPPAPSRPLPADPRGSPSAPQDVPNPSLSPARVSSLIEKFERCSAPG
ncbi:FYVE, RhoGEF and PH domain-containing protein 1-like [Hypanus sabinus]|uniref:FYVE, RhoGEF and PH domain-containing protein 1-like n=1 Tax=Hypanus sabinus TaxID=79690 RepID=UPI0028C4D771|nr:FYVE, RhoGEF and PH domain-containing protein 1-like [Hypanus sabinus]